MFKFTGEFPVQVVNWHDRQTEPDLAQGKTLFSGAVCGGLSQWEHLHCGTPNTIRDAAREAMQRTHSRRFILSTGCVAFVTTPLSNFRAAREAVEGA
jgi:uroporphyrinogen decarboxylase